MTEDEIIDMLFIYSVRRRIELGISKVSFEDIQYRSDPYNLLQENLPFEVWFSHVDRGMHDVRYFVDSDFSTRYYYDHDGTEILEFTPSAFYKIERKYFYYSKDKEYIQSVQDRININRLKPKIEAPKLIIPWYKNLFNKLRINHTK